MTQAGGKERQICPDCNHPWSRHLYGFGSCEDCTRAGACKPTPPVGETGPEPEKGGGMLTFEEAIGIVENHGGGKGWAPHGHVIGMEGQSCIETIYVELCRLRYARRHFAPSLPAHPFVPCFHSHPWCRIKPYCHEPSPPGCAEQVCGLPAPAHPKGDELRHTHERGVLYLRGCPACEASVPTTTVVGSARPPADRGEREPLDFARLRRVNEARCINGFKHTLDSWSVAEWTNAAAGEMGEACNIAKKMLRHRDGVAGNKGADLDLDALRRKLAREIADTVIYLDLVCTSQGIDLGAVVRDTFNAKSDELGAKERL